MVIFRSLLLLITSIVGATIIMANILKFLLSLGNTKSKLFREVNNLRLVSKNLHGELVPIDEGELKFLSYNQVPQKKFRKNKTNILTSIYNEPFVAYYIKQISGKESAVMVAYTFEKEYSYIIHKGTTEVFIDQQPFARIMENGAIKDLSNRTVGTIEKTPGSTIKKLIIHDTEVAVLKSPERISITSRAYNSLYTNTKNDEDLVLAVTLPDLVFSL